MRKTENIGSLFQPTEFHLFQPFQLADRQRPKKNFSHWLSISIVLLSIYNLKEKYETEIFPTVTYRK